MNEHYRALVALQAWEHGDEVPGGLAYADQLRAARLDYSLHSLARIDGFLDALRQQGLPAEAVFIESQGAANLLWLLACHAGELMGRAAGLPARWDSSDAAPASFRERAGCRFGPGVSARFLPLRAICARLFGSASSGLRAAFDDYFKQRFPAASLPAADRVLPPAPVPAWPADLDGSRANFSEADIAALRLNPPPWMPEGEAALAPLFAHHATLLRSGRVVWGALIAPDNAMHRAEYCGGAYLQLVYDPAGRVDAATLEGFADRLYNEVLPDPAARDFIYAEHPQLGLGVPAEVSPWPLRMAGSWVAQNQLPDGLLSLVALPLLIDPERPGIAAVLPAHAWPARLRERWLAAGDAKHGVRHDPDALRQKRIGELRDPGVRESLQQDMNYQWGARHFHGSGMPRDFVRARECWESSCREQNPYAMVALGVIHQQGLGVPIDSARARRCFQAASDLGLELGDFEMGQSYLTEGRVDMAQLYLRRAAAAGYAPAAGLLRSQGVATAPGDASAQGRRPARLLLAGLGCAALAAALHLSDIAPGSVVLLLGMLAAGLLYVHLRRRRAD